MIQRSYLQEIGFAPVEGKIPWPYGLLILAIFFASMGWFAVREVSSFPARSRQMDRAAMVTHHRPAPATAGAESPGKAGSTANRRGVT